MDTDKQQGQARIFTSYPKEGDKLKKYITWSDINAESYIVQAYCFGNDKPVEIPVPSGQTYLEFTGLPEDIINIEVLSYKNGKVDQNNQFSAVLYPSDNYPDNEDQKGSPYWYNQLPQEIKEKLDSQDIYKNYIQTTMNFYVNIGFVFDDNSVYTNPVTFRYQDDRILFHGDEENRPPYLSSGLEIIFGGGGGPPQVSGSLMGYPGIYLGALESYTYTLSIANGYVNYGDNTIYQPSAFTKDEAFIYLSNAPGGMNVTKMVDGVPGKTNEAEIAFAGGVRSKWILGVIVVNTKQETFTRYIRNPHSESSIGNAPEGTVDVIISTDKPDWNIKFKGIDNPDEFTISEPWKRLNKQGIYKLTIVDSLGEEVRSKNDKLFFNDKLVSKSNTTLIDFKNITSLDGIFIICYSQIDTQHN